MPSNKRIPYRVKLAFRPLLIRNTTRHTRVIEDDDGRDRGTDRPCALSFRQGFARRRLHHQRLRGI